MMYRITKSWDSFRQPAFKYGSSKAKMNNRMERVTHKSVHVFTGMLNHIMPRGALKSQSL